jgi:hypothetical protein
MWLNGSEPISRIHLWPLVVEHPNLEHYPHRRFQPGRGSEDEASDHNWFGDLRRRSKPHAYRCTCTCRGVTLLLGGYHCDGRSDGLHWCDERRQFLPGFRYMSRADGFRLGFHLEVKPDSVRFAWSVRSSDSDRIVRASRDTDERLGEQLVKPHH